MRSRSSTWDVRHSRRGRATTQHVRARQSSILTSNGPISSSANAPERCHVPGDGRPSARVRRHAAPWSAWKRSPCARTRSAQLRRARRHAAPRSAWKRTLTATCCVYCPRPTPRCAMERMETNTFVCGGTLISVKSDATLRPWSAWKPEAVGRAGSPTFQRRIVLSRPPLYRVRPSGLNDRPQTCPRCPTRGSDSGTFSVAISRVLRSAADGTPAVELRDQRLVGGVRLERSIEAGGDLGGAAELGGLRQDQVADRPGDRKSVV